MRAVNPVLLLAGCAVVVRAAETYTLIKEDAECQSDDMKLGEFATIADCADACARHHDCNFFIMGKGEEKAGW